MGARGKDRAVPSTETAPLSASQKTAILASYLGWTLDAFDFFLMVFLVKSISEAFGHSIKEVAEALFWTLAMRPVGALFFGWLADKYGRRPILMLVIVLFSVLSVLSGLAQTLGQLLLIRAVFGAAMGGEWGVGASLVMESIPPRLRGRVSGLLQSGYPMGYFLAALVFKFAFVHIGWRGMFFVGMAPALLVAFIRMGVEEPAGHEQRIAAGGGTLMGTLRAIGTNWKLALYLIVLMTAFNFFSHGTMDMYPTFLQKQHGFDASLTGEIVAFVNVGAICGALFFGMFSDRIGRKRAIVTAALCALPAIPLYAYGDFWASGASPLVLAAGGFLVNAAVQGAWSVIPAHLNELSPMAIRAMFPGFVYQLGNLFASKNGPIQAGIAESHGNNFALALASVVGVAAVTVALVCAVGPERSGEDLNAAR